MWYSPLAFYVGKRDVIGAWLLCLVVLAAFFGWTGAIAWPDVHAPVAASAKMVHATAAKCV